jgi:hypothetical protein
MPASYGSPIRGNPTASVTCQRGTRPHAYDSSAHDEQQAQPRRAHPIAVECARADYAGHGDGGLGYDAPAVIVVTNLVTTTTPPFVVVFTILLRRLPVLGTSRGGPQMDAYDSLSPISGSNRRHTRLIARIG